MKRLFAEPGKTRPRPGAPRNVLLVVTSVLIIVGCLSSSVVQQTPIPATTGQPAATEQVFEMLVPVVDDGSPLPPQVVEQKPKGGQELSLKGDIELTFDQGMDPATTEGALQLTGPDGKAVPGKITWKNSRTLHFTSGAPLQSGAVYRLSLGTNAASMEGMALREPLEISYQTTGDLQVSQVFPAQGTNEVAHNAVITAIFNRPVVALSISQEQKNLPNPLSISPPISGHGEWVSTSVYAFRPNEPLAGETTYSVTIPAGLEDATQDSSLAEEYRWQFTTLAPSIAYLELPNGEINPVDGYSGVGLEPSFAILFNQPMDQASTAGALSVSGQNGEPVALETAWNEDFTRVEITPTQRLALSTDYNLSLEQDAAALYGGSLKQGLDWNFTTVSAPRINATDPPTGFIQENYSGIFRVFFATPMNLDTLKDRIVVRPAPEGKVDWWYDPWELSYNAYFLDASTSYEVSFLPGMEDIYGNQITEGQTVRFTTAPRNPSAGLQMPYEPAFYRVGGPQDFYVSMLNVDDVDIRLYSLTAEQFVSLASGEKGQSEYVPNEDTLVWQGRKQNTGRLNQRTLENVKLVTQAGSELSPGFYFLGVDADEIQYGTAFLDTRLFVVSQANLTFKNATAEGLVWLTGLESGEPLAGIPITVYDKRFKTIGQGVTGEDGLLSMQLPPAEEWYEPRFAMTSGGDMFAFASTSWGSGVSMYEYGIWTDFYSPYQKTSVYVYTDRPIYRPGQPVYFKGIVRLDNDLNYVSPEQTEVLVTLSSSEEMISEMTLPLSEFATFDGQFVLDTGAYLGYYYLNVGFPGSSETIGSVSFNVAEYRKPEFQVEVTTDQVDLLNGDTFNASVNAVYYSGGSVGGATVHWTLTADDYAFYPAAGSSGYSFDDYDMDSGPMGDYTPYYNEVIAEGQAVTDANGVFTINLPADLSGARADRHLEFEATIIDLAGNVVSGRATVNVHRSQVYPGVKAKTYVGEAGKEQAFDLTAVDWDGKPVPGQKVSVEIVERRWYSVQEQDTQGMIKWTSTVEEIPVASFADVSLDQKGQAVVRFVPPNGGVFKARVTALDVLGNRARASAFMWVSGDDFIPWRQTNDRGFELVPDRDLYVPGDTAEILIASPFQGETYALVTVERGRILYQDVVLLTSNSTVYRLPIVPGMAPNVYVSVVIVKGVDDTSPRPSFKVGMTELKVDTREQTITVEIVPDRTEAGPGDKVTYTVRTLDYKGEPLVAELSLGLSDLATLSLSGPNTQPILDHFYSYRFLSVGTTIPLALSIEDYNATISESVVEGSRGGSGGGKGGGDFGVIAVRQDFPDTAFWEAHVVTDGNGEAKVTVTLPDNLTTWRMDARAVTHDTQVGQATLDIVSTKPLLVRPQTPRFFVIGDEARLGAAVHNNTGEALSASVTLLAEGASLVSEATQVVEIAAGQQAYVSWDVLVDTYGPDQQPLRRVDLTFMAVGGEYSDASRPTIGSLDGQGLPVYRYEARETVGTSGQILQAGTQVEAISLPAEFDIREGSLNIRLAPSLAAGMTDGLTYLEHYPYECVEQTISRFLPNVVSTRALKEAGLGDPGLEAELAIQVNTGLQRLYNWQNPDGGWGWWSNEKSDLQTTAYVVLGLHEAREAGYTVNTDVLEGGINFLRLNLLPKSFWKHPYQINRQAFVLYVLARLGTPDVSQTVQLYDERQNTGIYARAFLLQALYMIDPGDPRVQTLLSDLSSAAVLSATGSHWEESEVDYWNWNTDTRTTAIVLSVVSQIDPGNPLNANAARWLMSHRTGGIWGSTQETAWTLMALTQWMVASGELQADYNFAVAFNGERIGEGTANASTLRQVTELRVDVADMLSGEVNRLAIARDGSAGNLYYTAHLDLSLPVEHIQALDQGLVLSRSYYRQDEPTAPVTEAQWGDLLLARLTVVAPHDLHYVVINDPLPAGLEAVDQALLTSQQNTAPQDYGWDDLFRFGWGWWFFSHTQLRDEQVVLSVDYLPAGTYIYSYLVRATTVGTFRVIPPTGQEFYFPEVYGRGDGSLFSVLP